MADELMDVFLAEGRELTARAAEDLAALETLAGDAAALDSLFRALHTLKGSTALFDLAPLTAMLQAAETRLGEARTAGRLGPEAAVEIYRALDIADAWLDVLETGGGAEPALVQETLEATDGATMGDIEAAAGPPPAWALDLFGGRTGGCVALRYRPHAQAYFRGDDPLATIQALPGLVSLTLAIRDEPSEVYDPFRCTLELQALCAAPLPDVRAGLRFVADQVELVALQAAPERGDAAQEPARRSLRVDAAALDGLAALADELVIAKNALAHSARRLAEHPADEGAQREQAARLAAIDRLVGEVHAAVNHLRLLPLGRLFARFPRQVRELAAALGKSVELKLAGEQVTMDKSVVDGLFEPVLHLVRNAIDHGIEPAAERLAEGKSARATLSFSARLSNDEVVIEVSDDGRGLDVHRLREAAVAAGFMTAEAADALSDAEAAGLVFAAGFSTAEAVSEISGRGVGMDAVRSAVARIGGRVDLNNQPGAGLTVSLTLPARVVLSKVLVVTVGEERFGVPLEAVRETTLVHAEDVSDVRAGRAYVWRDAVAPLVRLADLVGLNQADERSAFPVVAVDVGGETVGVQVGRLAERLEAPLRPLDGLLRGFPGALGSVLEGDGNVLLVLDLEALVA